MKTQKKEVYNFQSETKKLLHLMIHSLYSNKEIFLRELISNSSDAIDKLRFESISSPELYENDSDVKIQISINKAQRTLIISDNGIGMTKEDTIENLGTIAKSGTKSFLQSLEQKQNKKNELIGEFGVGFYSSFIVSEKVSVRTRFAGLESNKGILWESSGEGEYNITNIVKKTRGTEITLFLKKEEEEFLETWRIKNIISKYSDHITIPIHIQDYDKKNKTYFWEQINKAKALWTLNKSSITEEEYKDFYKHLTNDQNDPLIWSHNHVEGNQEYISLLYIPEKAAWDIWNRDNKHGLKLYVKRVYIMDNSQAFLPNYLRFIKGLIDSSDLPLNISREILQDNSITEKLRKSLIKKSLSMLEKLAQKNNEKYQIFWNQFGLVLKEGPAEDHENLNKIANLLRFTSMKSNNSEQKMSLKEYISNMNEQQEKIYYITADSYSSANNSPHLELFKKNNIDVLLLSDRIDEWMMNYLSEFEGKKFQSISKEDISLNKLTKEKKIKNKDVSTEMIEFLKKVKNILGNQVKDVRLTHRLTETPCVLLSDSTEMTTQMAKLFSAAGQSVPELKYIFEINPDHILIKKICTINNENELHQWIKLLLDQALLAEKGNLENPHKFISRMNKLLIK
ncbi:molecular chaperone HtpG [Buchnera aphidicola str. APS (Acyrthosiphon pisum)]|uniref:Chaperone protein HtpG n=2 Tax=Buchnera aphidicola TaxID=9 RepID=HTPG_BUCAI|nr:molecular chaperone HtpG [Buchnera aphidicola]P57555.1 RecName: Full=Chaperone protein HtpG; AltName: Full=Heat shock protein HtpG; AltName: Full=High temperature protein G [Buchnera aphidicola str. APS (Acyrthosiphon pisum)]pir/D84986/ heat shock protein htpG [imported] - Buchnera sp. (strain APS) [Buchnera sp. (in: enterobacteria)]ACL30831.1 heat shock protein 90 [Buchnera aphidicola str. 5A (Acyrthosiphon pisum)]BAB13180.1 heat shock protein htpG [Buchnera aphidicola str. APS (Acyrthosiph